MGNERTAGAPPGGPPALPGPPWTQPPAPAHPSPADYIPGAPAYATMVETCTHMPIGGAGSRPRDKRRRPARPGATLLGSYLQRDLDVSSRCRAPQTVSMYEDRGMNCKSVCVIAHASARDHASPCSHAPNARKRQIGCRSGGARRRMPFWLPPSRRISVWVTWWPGKGWAFLHLNALLVHLVVGRWAVAERAAARPGAHGRRCRPGTLLVGRDEGGTRRVCVAVELCS